MLLGVVESGTPPPPADARHALAEALAAGSGSACASALVLEGDGFLASMVRAVATGLAMLARTEFPHRVFADIPTVASWLGQHCRGRERSGYDAAEVQSVLRELRRRPA